MNRVLLRSFVSLALVAGQAPLVNAQQTPEGEAGATTNAANTQANPQASQTTELVDAGRVLEEVIVNARRREELLQETPVAVSAFGAQQMEEAGIYAITDLEQHVPNLQFNQGTRKDRQIFIRGMGQRTDVSLFDPSVGVYLNSILIPRHDSALLETVDVSSVQVLRGPQGTLFGKNNTGGAILFGSNAPSLDEGGVTFFTRVGEGERRDLRLSGNIPLIEGKMGLRLAVSKTELTGYLDNDIDSNVFADESREAVSGRLLWNLTDNFSVDVFGFYSRTDELGLGPNCIFQNPSASMPNLAFPGQDTYEQTCRESEALAEDRKVAINSEDSRFTINNAMLAFTLDWSISDEWNLKSITGMNQWDNISRSDDADASRGKRVYNGTSAIVRTFAFNELEVPDENRWQITQELQFSGSAFDETLQYTVGVFGSMEEIEDTSVGNLVGEHGIGGVKPSLITGLVASNGLALPDPLASLTNDGADETTVVPFVTWLGTVSDVSNQSTAVFAEASWSPIQWLQLTAGGRYTTERRERTMYVTDVDYNEVGARIGATYLEAFGVFTPISRVQFDALENDPRELPIFYTDPQVGERTFEEFTPSATASILATDDWLDKLRLDSFMTYLTVSKGFKAGGLDAKGTELVVVKPERVKNYEWGFKLDGAGNRVRFNGSVFHTKWADMQLQNAELGDSLAGTEILLFFTNAGQATTQGAELEFTFALGKWFFNSNVSYLDAQYDEFIGNVATPFIGESKVDRSDEPLYMAPELTYSMAVQYEWLSPIGMIMPTLAYSYRDQVYTGLDQLGDEYDSTWADEIEVLNFRLMYIPSENIRMTLYVNNVTDKFYYASGLTNSEALGTAMLVQGPPRHAGVEFTMDF